MKQNKNKKDTKRKEERRSEASVGWLFDPCPSLEM